MMQLIGFSVPTWAKDKKSGEKSQCGQKVAVELPVLVSISVQVGKAEGNQALAILTALALLEREQKVGEIELKQVFG